MKLNLLAKYLLLYIVIAIVSLLTVTFGIYQIQYRKIYNEIADNLYHEAIETSGSLGNPAFEADSQSRVRVSIASLAAATRTRIMIVDVDGHVIADSSSGSDAGSPVLYTIDDFNVNKFNGEHVWLGDFYTIFSDLTMSVFTPITNEFTTRGYVVVSVPESQIKKEVYNTFATNYLTLALLLILSITTIGFYFWYVHRPLLEMGRAIDEYGKGNMSYQIKVKNNDEIGRLESSLNFMANQISQSDDFQKKFLSNISHDFRSPLTSIKGYLEAMADGTIPPEDMKKYLEIVLFETDRLTRLTSNILTLNEVEPDKVVLNIAPFDINAVIRHTIETMGGVCRKRDIHFSLTFCSSEELVSADKERIQQVVYNLVDNAIKFSPDSSTIEIMVTEHGDKVHVSVKDHGSGISKESLDKIWDRFYKSDSSRGRDKKGSGLGLSITREIIQAHRENIDCISTEGVGTEFIFTLSKLKIADKPSA